MAIGYIAINLNSRTNPREFAPDSALRDATCDEGLILWSSKFERVGSKLKELIYYLRQLIRRQVHPQFP